MFRALSVFESWSLIIAMALAVLIVYQAWRLIIDAVVRRFGRPRPRIVPDERLSRIDDIRNIPTRRER